MFFLLLPNSVKAMSTIATPPQMISANETSNKVPMTANPIKVNQGVPTKVVVKEKPRQSAQAVGGIGSGGTLAGPTGSAWGTSGFSFPVSCTLTDPFTDPSDNGKTQTPSIRVNGTFNVYCLKSGQYLVVYNETGEITPGTVIVNSSDGVGFFQCKFINQVSPFSPGQNGGSPTPFAACHWNASSPATLNQNTSHQDMVVDTFTQTVTIGVDPDGASGSYSASDSTQLWNSNTTSISDWGINETSQASNNIMSWEFHQQMPFEADTMLSNFAANYQECYDSDGNAVLLPPNLSLNALQYSTTSSWLFDAPQGNSLVVEFQGSGTHTLAFLSTPNYAGTGHHKLCAYDYSWNWSWQIDLYQIILQGY